MKPKPRISDRLTAKGRNKDGGGHHVRLHRWELESAAYRSLSVGARALLVELKALYYGNNNGALFLSVREAAKRLNCHKDTSARLFIDLVDRGFLLPNTVGHFKVKGGPATSWILTEFPIGAAMGAGTRDFMRWQPPAEKTTQKRPAENHSTVCPDRQSVRSGRTLPFESARSVLPDRTLLAKNDDRRSH